jgi:hypothetical protein
MSVSKMQQIAAEKKQLMEKLKALESQEIKKTFDDKLTVKIGGKGTINTYGLGKAPVCLYFSQMVRLAKLFANPEFQQFIKENQESLAQKAEKTE